MIEKFIETKTIVKEKVFCDKCREEIVTDLNDDDYHYPSHCIICDGDFCNNGICNYKFDGLGYEDDICPSCKIVIKFDEAKRALREESERKSLLMKQRKDAIELIENQYNGLIADSDKIAENIKDYYIRQARRDLGKIWTDG